MHTATTPTHCISRRERVIAGLSLLAVAVAVTTADDDAPPPVSLAELHAWMPDETPPRPVVQRFVRVDPAVVA